MTTKIKLRRAAAASWTSVNPILDLGEMGIETDTYKLKVGNGTDTWSNLAYFVHAWSDITGKPTVIASGSTKSAARSAIDAASLDSNGKVPASELPNSIMEYQGTWNASTNSPSLVDGTGSAGDVYRVSVAGSRNFGSGSISFDVGDYVIYSGSVWEKSDTTDAVSSVAGRTGAVTLTVADIGGDTSTALGVGSLNVGHASDTTVTRASAGVIAVEGVNVLLSGGALGTPSSGTLSNCTSLPVSGITSSTTATLGVGALELGHASDTSITRVSAGVVAIENANVVTTSSTDTLTNKTLTNPTVNNYTEGVVAIGTVSSSHTIALTNGTVQTATLTASTATTFTMPTATAGKSFVLLLKQAASTGNGSATFTGVKWGTSGAPTITATAGRMDILSFFADGTNWYGSATQGFTP